MTALAGILAAHAASLAQGIPLAPALSVRLIALLIVEIVLLTLVVLLYILWIQFKGEPLGEWWARRKAEGLSGKTLGEIEESERERIAAGAPPADPAESSAGGGTAAAS